MATPYVLKFRGSVPRIAEAPESLMRHLAAGDATEQEIHDEALEAGGAGGLALVMFFLQHFRQRGWLTYSLPGVATWFPMTTDAAPPEPVQAGRLHRLSRFALMRSEGALMVLESPLAPARVVLHSPEAVAQVAQLSQPAPPTADPALLGLLAAAGALCEGDEEPALAMWEFHDLLFHARSRLGRHNDPAGATYPFERSIDPLPALKPGATGEVVELPRADLGALMATDRTLTDVLESRRSIRRLGDEPISVRELGEFLYRTARARSYRPATETAPYETAGRPFPGGGGCYELELYLTVSHCEGLERGIYHYDPKGHRLTRVAGPSPDMETLLSDAHNATARQGEPQVLITYAARFGRVSWKYRAMAYAVILKDVGVLYQTMYLVAEAMNLAPCALGVGNSDRFARAIGSNYYEESSVGEFLLGSRPPA